MKPQKPYSPAELKITERLPDCLSTSGGFVPVDNDDEGGFGELHFFD